MFMPLNFLFEEVLAARAQSKYLQFIKRLSAVKVLQPDAFGLRNYTHEAANVLDDLLEDRHRKGSVLVTSQAEPRGWKKLFEDPEKFWKVVDR